MSNNTASSGATNASNGTKQGCPNPASTTSGTADNNITSPKGADLTATGDH